MADAAETMAIDLVSRAIQANHLQTRLEDAEWVDPNESAVEAVRRLEELDFDQAPVGQRPNVEGFVLRTDLQRADKAALARAAPRSLDAHHVVSADASLRSFLHAFEATPVVFVVDGYAIDGFLTPSDLNKHAARIHFDLLLSSLEGTLSAWVRSEFTDLHAALSVLGDEAKKVRGRHLRDQRHYVAIDLATGMDLGHLLTLVGTTEPGRERFGAPGYAWGE